MTKAKQKKLFIHNLAEFLAGNAGAKGIMLQVEQSYAATDPRPKLAKEWASLLNCAPWTGYINVSDAENALTDFL